MDRGFLKLLLCFLLLHVPDLRAETENADRNTKTRVSIYKFIPSQANKNQEAQEAAALFFSRLDSGDKKIKLDATLQLVMPFLREKDQADEIANKMINAEALYGDIKSRQFIRISIYKNPPQAPALGIFAAIDITSQYKNADRSCGYIVLQKNDDNDKYKAIRFESITISNDQARDIEVNRSKEGLGLVWKNAVQKYCPGGTALPK